MPLLFAAPACNAIFGVDDLAVDDRSGGASPATGGGGVGGVPMSATVGGAGGTADGGQGGTTAEGGLGGAGGNGGAAGSGGTGGSGGSGGAGGITDPFCDGRFGGLPFYTLCDAPGNFCKFFRQVIGSSCLESCRDAGVTCLDSDDQGATRCTEATDLSCPDQFNDVICTCSRGCGTGAPCDVGQQCIGGVCQ